MELVSYNADKSDDSVSHSPPPKKESNHEFVNLRKSSTDSQFKKKQTTSRTGLKQHKRTTNTVTCSAPSLCRHMP
jgi:hypothetical protein